jgi:hypothetical protein
VAWNCSSLQLAALHRETPYNPSKRKKNSLHPADFTSAFHLLLCAPFQSAKMDSYHAGNAFYVDEDYEAAAEVG